MHGLVGLVGTSSVPYWRSRVWATRGLVALGSHRAHWQRALNRVVSCCMGCRCHKKPHALTKPSTSPLQWLAIRENRGIGLLDDTHMLLSCNRPAISNIPEHHSHHRFFLHCIVIAILVVLRSFARRIPGAPVVAAAVSWLLVCNTWHLTHAG